MRTTKAIVNNKIKILQDLAIQFNLEYVTSYGLYSGLRLYSANGTHALHAQIKGSTGITEVGSARGLREIAIYLDGMIAGLASQLHN